MKALLKILILEDNDTDAELVQQLLQKEKLHCEFRLAINKETYLLALDQFYPDIILSDHSLPQFDSADALAIARQRFPGIPFIMVTGMVSEEFAASIIKLGADDYILKDRMARLPAVIIKTIERHRSEKEKQEAERKIIQSETHLRTIFENTSEGFLLLDRNAVIMAFNNKATAYTFFSRLQEFKIGQCIYNFIEDSRKEFVQEIIAKTLRGENIQYDRSYEMENGNIAWIDFSATPVIEAGQVKGICIAGRDITEKKIIEHAAEAIAFFLTPRVTEFSVIEEAIIGTGFDYWLGYDESHDSYDSKNFLQARLEVSGIKSESITNTIQKRVKEKKQQTIKSENLKLPAYVSVTEFASPKTYFGKK